MNKFIVAMLCLLAMVMAGAASTARADDLIAAVLPSSRSGVVGKPVTVYATMINTSGQNASGCAVTTSQSGLTLSYQPTNPATNKPVGAPNTPVAIAANQAQSFILSVTASAAMQAVDVPLTFDCTGLQPAAIISGLDTLLLTITTTTEPPDIVAIAVTVGGTGILSTNGGSAAFAVASIDVGAGAAITVTPSLGDLSSLPVTLTICQTDATGACMATAGASANNTYTTDSTATFGVFATATGPIPFAPSWARVFVVFTDSNNVVRGETSVALGATPNPNLANANPGGIYVGTWRVTSTPTRPQPITAMVSEDGEFHLLPSVSDDSSGGFGADGPADFGQIKPIMRETLMLTADQNLNLTGSGTAYAAGAGPTAATGSVTVTGLYSPQHVIILTYTNGTEQGTFNLNYVRQLYQQPSSLAALTGTWQLRDESLPSKPQGSLTVAADGTFTGTGTTGCAETGSFTIIDAKFSIYGMAVNQAACSGAAAATFNGLATIQTLFGHNAVLAAELSNPTTAVMNFISTH